jgi:hypothetical protein
MKLYIINQSERRDYDTYSSAVVCANSIEEAKTIHPTGDIYDDQNFNEWNSGLWQIVPISNAWRDYRNWATHPDNVSAQYIGEAAEDMKFGVVLASYHAG